MRSEVASNTRIHRNTRRHRSVMSFADAEVTPGHTSDACGLALKSNLLAMTPDPHWLARRHRAL
ncbi:MAG: hypothetical protein JO278_15225 [Dyella sp.]|nr:hypothetical protein [Dyella sp.]